MPRFFLSGIEKDGRLTITGPDAHHIGFSLRMAAGERITVCDLSAAKAYTAVIDAITPDSVLAHTIEELANSGEPPYAVTLFQGLPKSDKMDSIVQKAVECGCARIRPFESRNCIVRLKNADTDKKTARWQRIAQEAAKQCGRSVCPEVLTPVGFTEMLAELSGLDLVLFCYEGEIGSSIRQRLESLTKAPGKIGLVIGPEGGFDPLEAERIGEAGGQSVTLGPRILRTETAAPVALAQISYAFELAR